jgi:Septum formation
MRRQVELAFVMLSLATTGCTPRAGGGAEPVARWVSPTGASPSATGSPVLEVGQCYTENYFNQADTAHLERVDCAKGHTMESAQVGQLTGAAAQLFSPPANDAAELADVDRQCSTAATEYVGGPLVDQRLIYLVVLPSKLEWAGGARWYTCDVAPISPYTSVSYAVRVGSVRGIAKAPPPDPVCFKLAKKDTTEGMTGVACDSPHNAEFVSSLQPPFGAVLPTSQETWIRYVTMCRDRIATVMGVSQAAVIQKWGNDAYRPSEEEWRAGLRVIQCYFVLWTKTVAKSIRGSHGAGIPGSWWISIDGAVRSSRLDI